MAMIKTCSTPPIAFPEVSGPVCSFKALQALPLKKCEVAINAWQEGSGDPSPENVRAIHGFDKVRIGMVDFNQITRNGNFSTLEPWSTFSEYGTISVNNNECVYTFTRIENSRYLNTLRYGLYMIPTHKYFLSSDCYVTKPSKALIYNIGNAKIMDKTLAVGWNRVQGIMNANFATEGNKSCYIGLEFCEDYNYQVGDTYKMKNVMAFDLTQMFGSRIADYLYNLESNQEGAGVAVFRQLFYKDYYAYNVGGTWVAVASVNGDDYPVYAEISLGETIYGGSYNSVSGKLINDSEIYDMGDLHWRDDINGVFYAYMSDMELKTSYAFCSVAKLNNDATVSTLQVGEFGTKYGNGGSVWFPRGSYNTANEFKTANAGNKIVVRIKTPIETNIGPTPIDTILNTNNIFADTGDTTVQYIKIGG